MKIATNTEQRIEYTTIVSLEVPTTMIAVDDEGKKYNVPSTATVGDVLVFPTVESQPIAMPLELFKVGRILS
jgi:hypothetical protein